MAVRVYPRHETANRRTINILRRKWMASILKLEDNWILAKANHVERRAA
jgi:hypothetical protein